MPDEKPAQDARIRDHFWPQRRHPSAVDIEAMRQLRDELNPRTPDEAGELLARRRDQERLRWAERWTRFLAQVFVGLVGTLLAVHLLVRCAGGA